MAKAARCRRRDRRQGRRERRKPPGERQQELWCAILIGEATERLARGAIIAREIDSIAVYRREEGIAVHELIGLAGEDGSIGFCRVGSGGLLCMGLF